MAFPWELNLERPYREKRSFQEELVRRDSIDSGLGGSATTPDGFPARQRHSGRHRDGSEPGKPGKSEPGPLTVARSHLRLVGGSRPLTAAPVTPISHVRAFAKDDHESMSPTNPWRHPPGVPRCEQPRAEGRFFLPGGRRLGYRRVRRPVRGESFSGSTARLAAGASSRSSGAALLRSSACASCWWSDRDRACPTRTPTSQVADWATDMAHVADALGADRLGVVGLSGGGPYALACAGSPALARRVAAVAVLGGVTPSVGPDAGTSGAIELARTFAPALSALRRPLAAATRRCCCRYSLSRISLTEAYAGLMPEGDQRVFADPEHRGDVHGRHRLVVAKGRFQAIIDDARAFRPRLGLSPGRCQGARAVVARRRRPIVTFDDAQTAASRLPDAELILMPDESHLGGFAAADDVLGFIRSHL